MVQISEVSSAAEVDAVRALFGEYKKAVGVDLWFGGFEGEIADLPAPYVRPGGRLLLARHGSEVAGCGGLRRLQPRVGELRRMWVRPPFRRHGLGRAIAEALLRAARECGYASVRLETLWVMPQARALYLSMGFAQIPDDRPKPFPGSVLMEIAL